MSEGGKNFSLGSFSGLKTLTIKKKVNIEEKIYDKEGYIKPKEVSKSIQLEGMAGKKQKFEFFLTQRKRFSRLAGMQGLYFYEQFAKFNNIPYTFEEEVNEVYRTIIYFYKRFFFHEKYGTNKKNKKLEEKFVRKSILYYISNKEKVDGYIKKYLAKNWRISRLSAPVRAGLRCAIVESIISSKKQFKLIVSEYTDLIANTITEQKEIAFFNAILDNIIKEIKQDYEK